MQRLSLAKLVSSNHDRRYTQPLGAVGPSRCPRPLGVVRLAMRRHSLTELVQFNDQSVRGTHEGSMDHTQLVVAFGGAP